MTVVITDTHTIIWYLYSGPRLEKAASDFRDGTIARDDHIGISAISIAEMIHLAEKGRIPTSTVRDLHDTAVNLKGVLQFVPLDEHVA
jgi:PIN domain nuclease of toxin-antitoxin system